jgi:FkbM family methyltransferase
VSRFSKGLAIVRAELRAKALRRSLDTRPQQGLTIIGDLSYGGYRVPVDWLSVDSVVYAVGVGEDARFDLELIRRVGCTVRAMDPVPRAGEYARTVSEREPRYVFHQVAVWSRDEPLTFHAPRQEGYVSHSAVNTFGTPEAFQAEGRSIRSLMNSWDHDHIDLLKISAEGAEFEILETLLRDGPTVPILCAEFTLPPLSLARQMLNGLAGAGYELVSAYVVRGYWAFTWLHRSHIDAHQASVSR